MTKIFLLILISQQPEWVYQYVHPDIGDEWPNAIAVDSFGNSYVTGVIGPVDTSDTGGVGVILLDLNGNEKGVYKLIPGGYGNDIVISCGYIYIIGDAYTQVGYPNFLILCTDTIGNIRWIYRDTLRQGRGEAISMSINSYIYATGVKYFNQSDIIVLKLDSLGNLKWQYIYDGGSYDDACDIEVDDSENVYVAGYTTNPGASEDFCVLKIDSSGNLKWVYTYNGPANYWDEVYAMTLDEKSNIYITGRSWGIDADICVIKLDSSGNEKWVYRYNGSGNWYDEGRDITVDDSGNVYICGISIDYDSTTLFTVIKIDSSGNERWVYLDKGVYNTTAQAQSITLDGFGNLYVCGFCEDINGNAKIYLVKMNLNGDTLWKYIYSGSISGDDVSRKIVADISGNIYLTGKVAENGGDIIVMKFKNETGTEERNWNLGVRDWDLRNYKIFDITGRKIKVLNKKGIYFLKDKNKIRKKIFLRR